jgi:hypothetical protein
MFELLDMLTDIRDTIAVDDVPLERPCSVFSKGYAGAG